MDPLSIIASSIAIASPLWIGLQKLRDNKRAKADLFILSNEVAEIIIILQELDQILKEQSRIPEASRPSARLLQYLQAANEKLEQLAQQLTEWEQQSRGSSPLRWAQMSPKMKGYAEAFQHIRKQLQTVLSVLNLLVAHNSPRALTASGTELSDGNRSASTRIQLDLQDIVVLTRQTVNAQKQVELQQLVMDKHERVESLLEMIASGISGMRLVEANLRDDRESISEQHNSRTPSNEQTENRVRAFHHSGPILFESAQMTAVAAVGIRTAQFNRNACTPWCSCLCHKESSIRTPQLLDRIIGTLFVGYSGLPRSMPQCNQKSCHLRAQPRAYATYYFPRWFLSRVVLFMMTYTPLAGPVATLKVQRTVPGSADIFTFAKNGDVARMKSLFENGLASPHDVHAESGVTALHIAISHQQLNVCRFLLQANADPFMNDYSHWAAADNAWGKILSRSLPQSSETTLRELFSDTECLERREFTVLHKIVLGLVGKDLDQELEASTAELDTLDSNERTPLSLAAERGDADAVSILLQYGANCEIPSNCGCTPLHFAACAKDSTCLRLLLDSGALVDPATNWDQTPLHYAAAYNKSSSHVALLLDAGADIDKRDRDGISPLGWAAISNNSDVTGELLKRKAEIDVIDLSGSSPLQECIRGNTHGVLELLVRNGARADRSFPDGASALRLIASYADLETIRLLRSVDFSTFAASWDDLALSYGLEALSKRADRTESLEAEFRTLWGSAKCNDDSGESDEEFWEDANENFDET